MTEAKIIENTFTRKLNSYLDFSVSASNYYKVFFVGSGITGDTTCVCYNSSLGMYICFKQGSGYSLFYYSYNGTSWTDSSALTFSPLYMCKAIAYNDAIMVAVFSVGSGSNSYAYSTDGITWVASTLPFSLLWSDIQYSKELNMFVAIPSTGSYIIYSYDGLTWSYSSIASSSMKLISWSPELSMFIVVKSNELNYLVSYNGINWSTYSFSSSSLGTLVDGSSVWSSELGIFFIYTYSNTDLRGYLFRSSDGIRWSLISFINYRMTNIYWSKNYNFLFMLDNSRQFHYIDEEFKFRDCTGSTLDRFCDSPMGLMVGYVSTSSLVMYI